MKKARSSHPLHFGHSEQHRASHVADRQPGMYYETLPPLQSAEFLSVSSSSQDAASGWRCANHARLPRAGIPMASSGDMTKR